MRAVLLFALLLTACEEPGTFDAETCEVGPNEGDCIADYALIDQHGDTVRRTDFGWQVVVIGEMWCTLCKEMARDLEDFRQANPQVGFVLIEGQDWTGGDVDASEVAAFAADEGFTFPVLAGDGTFQDGFKFGTRRPRSFLVDPQGVIQARVSGRDAAAMEAAASDAID